MLSGKPADVSDIEAKRKQRWLEARAERLRPTPNTSIYMPEAEALKWIEKYRAFARKDDLRDHPDHSGKQRTIPEVDAAVMERYEEVIFELGKDEHGQPDIHKRNFINLFRERMFEVAYASVRRAETLRQQGANNQVQNMQPFHELSPAVQFFVFSQLALDGMQFHYSMRDKGCRIDYSAMVLHSPVVYEAPRELNAYYRQLVATTDAPLNEIQNRFFKAPRDCGQEARKLALSKYPGASSHPLAGRAIEKSTAVSEHARPALEGLEGGTNGGSRRHMATRPHEHLKTGAASRRSHLEIVREPNVTRQIETPVTIRTPHSR